jgi:hypothetical protein
VRPVAQPPIVSRKPMSLFEIMALSGTLAFEYQAGAPAGGVARWLALVVGCGANWGCPLDTERPVHQTLGRLYSPGQVALATLLGAPIAGALLLAANYRELGEVNAPRKAVVWGLVGTVLLLMLSFVLPDSLPNSTLPMSTAITVFLLAKNLQGTLYDSHVGAGGPKHSSWRAAGIGAACCIAILLIMFCLLLILPDAWVLDEGGSI